jgi:hypothetical protein
VDRRYYPDWFVLLASDKPQVRGVKGGHSVPALSCGKVNLNRMAVKAVSQEPETLEEFYRSDLSLPYEPKGARVTDAMLRHLSTGLTAGQVGGGGHSASRPSLLTTRDDVRWAKAGRNLTTACTRPRTRRLSCKSMGLRGG